MGSRGVRCKRALTPYDNLGTVSVWFTLNISRASALLTADPQEQQTTIFC